MSSNSQELDSETHNLSIRNLQENSIEDLPSTSETPFSGLTEIPSENESFKDEGECLRKNNNSFIFHEISEGESSDAMNSEDEAAIDDSKQPDFNYRSLRNQIQEKDDEAIINNFKTCLPSLSSKSCGPHPKRRKTAK